MLARGVGCIDDLFVRRIFHAAARAAVDDLQVKTVATLAARDDRTAAKSFVVGHVIFVAVSREGATSYRGVTERSQVVSVVRGDIGAHAAGTSSRDAGIYFREVDRDE